MLRRGLHHATSRLGFMLENKGTKRRRVARTTTLRYHVYHKGSANVQCQTHAGVHDVRGTGTSARTPGEVKGRHVLSSGPFTPPRWGRCVPPRRALPADDGAASSRSAWVKYEEVQLMMTTASVDASRKRCFCCPNLFAVVTVSWQHFIRAKHAGIHFRSKVIP